MLTANLVFIPHLRTILQWHCLLLESAIVSGAEIEYIVQFYIKNMRIEYVK